MEIRRLHHSEKDLGDRLLHLRRVAALQFREEHWQHVAEIAGCHDVLRPYHKLGSVHWGDHGYDACVLHVLTLIAERNLEAISLLEEYAAAVCAACEEHGFSNATLTRL